MKRFLAIYTGTREARQRSGWDALDPDTRREREQAGMAAWGAWMERNQQRIVEAGGPLGRSIGVPADPDGVRKGRVDSASRLTHVCGRRSTAPS